MDPAADAAAVAVASDPKGPEMELERYAASPYGFCAPSSCVAGTNPDAISQVDPSSL